jgi:hypothetical protein
MGATVLLSSDSREIEIYHLYIKDDESLRLYTDLGFGIVSEELTITSYKSLQRIRI